MSCGAAEETASLQDGEEGQDSVRWVASGAGATLSARCPQ